MDTGTCAICGCEDVNINEDEVCDDCVKDLTEEIA